MKESYKQPARPAIIRLSVSIVTFSAAVLSWTPPHWSTPILVPRRGSRSSAGSGGSIITRFSVPPLPPPPPTSSSSNALSPRKKGLGQDVAASTPTTPRGTSTNRASKRRMELMWCGHDACKDMIREQVVGSHNHIILTGPATGQVAYAWGDPTAPPSSSPPAAPAANHHLERTRADNPPAVFILVREGDDDLMASAAGAVRELCRAGVVVLLDPGTAARMKHYHGVDDDRIHLYEARSLPGYGSNLREPASHDTHDQTMDSILQSNLDVHVGQYSPDLICTMGGDGLLMHAAMMFQGPIPPVLCVSGGSMGFLAVFRIDEMVDAVLNALDMTPTRDDVDHAAGSMAAVNDVDAQLVNVFPPNMPTYPYRPLLRRMDEPMSTTTAAQQAPMDRSDRICLSIRMRLECSVFSRDGTVKARYNVLNEVVVDRGCSQFLAALDFYVDNVHFTTIQADGVIVATPTGSTAYSLAAGSSLVHPAVPGIVLTPICPHVLSFRPMVFPDSVVLRCTVPFDARSEACVAFDGKHRQELRRGDSIQIRMSPYPVPTINRRDHSSDWMDSLKRNFNFNERPRQRPLRIE